nr:reverse transcriptase domain-containing protein [Tanacetum cinerariifolium]
MYVDGESSLEIIYEHCFNRLRQEIKNLLVPATAPLIGFSVEIIWPIGQIQLLVTIGDEEHSASSWMNFMVVRSPSTYNGIIGRPGVRRLQAVSSTAHEMLKILVEGEERIKVAINPEHPDQTVMIGSTLTEEGRNRLCNLLQCNLDIFAWKPADMIGIPRHIAKHSLNLISELPMLTAPMEKEELIVYLAATKETVRAVLMMEREAKQMPIYFVSRALRGEDSSDTLMEAEEELPEPWILFMDGSSCTDGSGVGLILTNSEGVEFTYALRFSFKAFSIKQIPISENKKADTLSKIASTSFAHLSKQVLVEELKEKSISTMEVLAVVEERDTWMTPIFKYLTDGTLPADAKKARAVKRKSWRFAIVNRTIYKKSFLGPWLRCIRPLQANYVLKEIHEGSCNMHVDSDSPERLSWTMENSSGTIHSRIGKGIKARLDARSKNLIEEIPHVLWAHRTMIKSSNGDTPFSLMYGTKATIPVEIGMPTLRTAEVDLVSFKPGDLVYRNNDASQAEDTGKLGPRWEGPYEVTESLGKGAYKLRDRDEKQLPRTWNIRNLKKCYIHK